MIELPFPEIMQAVRAAAQRSGQPVHLVGGSVRDLLLGRPIHDLDFALPGRGLSVARRTADVLGGAFFALDTARDTGRVLLDLPDEKRLVLDFSAYRGADLESDLRDRDFTLNAIAINLDDPQAAIDPTGGVQDARQGILRACAPTALANDPLRILRAVRLSCDLQLRIEPDTRRQIRATLPRLEDVSPERLRDELFKMLDGPRPALALRTLEALGALSFVLPELAAERGVLQSPPHIYDVYEHSLHVAAWLLRILKVLRAEYDPQAAANWTMGLVSVRLGRYRRQLAEHLAEQLNPERSLQALLLLAALYHDVGKPGTRSVDDSGRIR
ncbi:MAG: hypothetical protein ACKOC5_00985, partial [Chloroflexota bacterium]